MGSNRREGTMELLDESFDIDTVSVKEIGEELITVQSPEGANALEHSNDLGEPWTQEEGADETPTAREKNPCPDCGKLLTWLADGSRPRKHKCEPIKEKWVCAQCGKLTCEHEKLDGYALVSMDTFVKKEETASSTISVTADLVISKFVETRDTIAKIQKRHKEEIADLKALQDRRGLWLKGQLDEMGLDSFKTAHGSCFTVEKSSASVADRQIFLDWVHADWVSREGFLENRVSKGAVKQRLEDGEVLPPGVSYTTFKDVQIRRS